ncbi:MAG: hypothetical protein HY901_31605 [Deltaproteobacteria bacterium]|nr:hypothetical protein [Deltaproteobacteria bacterium]
MKGLTTAASAALALLFSLAVVSSALAHGKQEHIMGTVQKVSDDSLVIETTKKELVTITLASDTKYLKSGEPATLKDIKRGERVAVDGDAHGVHIIAKVVRFGAPQKMQH